MAVSTTDLPDAGVDTARVELPRRPTVGTVVDILERVGSALILGPAGSGRTHLLGEVERWESERGRTVTWLRGHHRGGPSATPPLDRHVTQVADLASALGAAWDGPATLLVDDAHLLDADTLDALTAWVERRAVQEVRVVVAQRCGVTTEALAVLAGVIVSSAGAVNLGPLTIEDLTEWIDGDDPSPGRTTASHLLARTGGWPALVAAELRGPSALRELIDSRLGLLGKEALDTIRAGALGFQLGSPAAVALTGCSADRVDGLVEEAMLAGVLHDRSGPVPAVAEVVRAGSPEGWRIRAAEVAATRGLPGEVRAVADALLDLGHRSGAAGPLFVRAASDRTAPAALGAGRKRAMLDAAVECGCDPEPLRRDRARAALADRSPTVALRLVGPADQDDADTETDLIRAAAWARLLRWDLAADHYDRADRPQLAAYARLGTGERVEPGPPGERSRVGEDGSEDLVEGIRRWLDGDIRGGRRALERAVALSGTHDGTDSWPDTPHAVLASMLLHEDRDGIAPVSSLLSAAEENLTGGAGFARRHRLLGAWAALRRGEAGSARTALASEPDLGAEPRGDGLDRDDLLAAGLRALVALLDDDPEAAAAAFRTIEPSIGDLGADPLAIPLSGAVAMLASRARADVTAVTDRIDELITGLGGPPLHTAWAAWIRLVVAATAEDEAGVARAREDLSVAVAEGAPPGAEVLGRAGSAYAAVLEGEVDQTQVTSAADDLIDHGLIYEARRLLGAAALRGRDPRVSRDLLARVRRLKGPDGSRSRSAGAELSARELEVAEALTTGLTHKEIGAQLYISAKTVEHHVARIRQKLGVSTRAELMAAIGEVLAESA